MFASIQVEWVQTCLLIEALNLNSLGDRQDLSVPLRSVVRLRSVAVTEPSSEKPIENTSGSQLLDYLNVISLPLNVRSDHWLHFSISFATNASSPAEPSSDEFGTKSIYISSWPGASFIARAKYFSSACLMFLNYSKELAVPSCMQTGCVELNYNSTCKYTDISQRHAAMRSDHS